MDIPDRFGVFLLVLTLVAFNAAPSYCEDNSFQASNQIEANSEPIRAEINVKHGAQRHWFSLPDSKPYTILVESYQSPLVVWVATSDGSPLIAASPLSDYGQYLYRATIEAKAGVLYQIGVGIESDVSPPVVYRLGLYSSNKVALPLDSKLNIVNLKGQVGDRTFDLSDPRSVYFNHSARFFEVLADAPSSKWVVARASANSFVPRVLFFNLADQAVIGTGWYSRQEKISKATARVVDSGPLGLVVYAGDVTAGMAPPSLGHFDLKISFFEQNPEAPLLFQLLRLFSNPFVSLATGTFAGGIISYILYRRSISGKCLLYHLEYDRIVINSATMQRSQLSVVRNSEQVTDHVGLCSIAVRLAGHKDIMVPDISETLGLRFNGMDRILLVSGEATRGWSDVSVPSGPAPIVQIHPRHLKPGDHISLNVFYTQKQVRDLSVKPLGKIYNGSFRMEANIFDLERLLFMVRLLGLTMLIGSAIFLLDDLFDFIPVEIWTSVHSLWDWYIIFSGAFMVSIGVFFIAAGSNLGMRVTTFLRSHFLSTPNPEMIQIEAEPASKPASK